MTLTQWLNDTWKHLTLSPEMVNAKGAMIRIPEVNLDLTSGLFSTDNLEEFEDLAFHLSPVGTIRDHINEDYYQDKLLRARNMLTKQILMTKNSRLAKQYLEILERRDKKRWKKESSKEVKASATDAEGKKIDIVISDFSNQ